MGHTLLILVCLLFIECKAKVYNTSDDQNIPFITPTGFKTIHAIPLPDGYERIVLDNDSFGSWLRSISLKKDPLVYLHDGSMKRNQSVQFAVLNISVGKKDLQQCADAVMRLRAEYLFAQGRYEEIVFRDNDDTPYAWKGRDNRQGFDKYLEAVFAHCGTASLERQLQPVSGSGIQPGDVFIKGGFPGHAMIVVDVAINKEGKKIFMLAQSYMPAQDIHIVKNPLNETLSPWYHQTGTDSVVTPEWQFSHSHLRAW